MGWLFDYDPIDCVYKCIYNHGIVINYYWRLLMDRLLLSILLSTMILYEYYYYYYNCLLLYIYTFIDYDSGDWIVLLKIMYIHVFFFKKKYFLTIIILTMLWLTHWLLMMIPLLTPCFPRRGPWVQPPRRCLSWKSIGKRKHGRTRHGMA